MSNIKYSMETINDIKSNLPYSKVPMKGFYDDLLRLKEEVEKLYDKDVFYLGYSLSEAPYHGWSGENLKEMREIDREIVKRFHEIYAIILSGLGE